MAEGTGMAGAHKRTDVAIGADSTAVKGASEAIKKSLRKPLEVKYHTVRYPNDKIKVVESAYYAVPGGAKDERIKKTRVACIKKGTRILSGRMPDGYTP